MSYLPKPSLLHPRLPTNELGLTARDYEGPLSTLCAGCGHDSIGASIIQSCFEMNIEAHNVVKVSGIGCSSKLPTYFLGKSHGFNSVHGRMPSVATGAALANRDLLYIGMSGDGDTASIGLGQFAHAIRRKLNMVYIVANNGVYGLTKGQFSATSDAGSSDKKGAANLFDSINLVPAAIDLGASFVARSFSGDKEQLVPLIKAAIAHHGFALIDVVSPCVTFNDHQGSSKSYEFFREHNAPVIETDYVPVREEITVSYRDGESKDVVLHDGSVLRLKKIEHDYDPCDKVAALRYIQDIEARSEIPTGLLYIDPDATDFHDVNNTTSVALNKLTEDELCPGKTVLNSINDSLR